MFFFTGEYAVKLNIFKKKDKTGLKKTPHILWKKKSILHECHESFWTDNMGTGHSSKKNVSIIINYLFIYYYFILEFQAELNGSMGNI